MMGFPLGAYQDCFGTRQPLELVNPALVKPPLLIFSSSHPLISLLPSFLPLSGLQFFFFFAVIFTLLFSSYEHPLFPPADFLRPSFTANSLVF